LPSTSTSFDSSTIQTNFREAAATIFSRVSAPPPPLTRRSVCVGLVGAVDVHLERAGRIEIEHLDAGGRETFAGRVRRRHRPTQASTLRGQRVDEEIDRRTGADADYGVVLDELECGDRCGFFA
jgi:hypothetical protein